MKRFIHHDPGSILNVMTIELEKNSNTQSHYNKDRDEVLFLLEGELKLLFDNNKSILLSSKDSEPWHLIKANITHKLECLTDKVRILEVIGGVHREDSCVNIDFASN